MPAPCGRRHLVGGPPWPGAGRNDPGAVQAVASFRAWLGGRDPTRPYFAFFDLMEAHLPYLAPRPFGPSGTAGRAGLG